MNTRIQNTIIFILLVMIIFSVRYYIRKQNNTVIQNQNIAPTLITVPSISPTTSISPTHFEDNPDDVGNDNNLDESKED